MPQPTVPAVNPYDYVTCAKHNARRLARFCAPCPVYNADHEIINYVFECKEGQLCSSAQRQANSNTHATSRSGVMDSQANLSGRRAVHDDAAQDSTIADKTSGAVQAMVFDASSSSNTNTAMHVNALRNAGGGGSGALHKSNESAAQGTTLFSVSFTAPKETTGARPANRVAGEADALAATSDATAQQQQVSGTEDEEVHASGQLKSTSCAEPDEQHKKDDEEEIVDVENKIVSTRPTNETATADKPLTTSASSSSPSTQFNSPRAPLRYYDMLQRAGGAHGGIGGGMMTGFTGHGAGPGGSSMPKKVCWYCGLAGHEKQECTNTLCRNCHTRRPANQYNPHNNNNNTSSSASNNNMPAYHTCVPVREVSPFIVVPRILPQGRDGMPAVRCVSCGAYGHFDCSAAAAATTTTPFSRTSGVEGQHEEATTSSSAAAAVPSLSSPVATGSLNCCFCGNRGHTAFDCYERKRVNPDRWEQRVLALSGAENCSESEARYHNNNTPSYTNYQGNANSSNNNNYRQGYRGNATRSETERGAYYGTSSTGLSYQGQQQQQRGAQNYNTPGNYYSNSNELAASSRRRPREAYESGEYATPRTYREERMTRESAVREYDATVSASHSASRRGDEGQQHHHRSAGGSHTTHHSHHSDHHHHRHHRSHTSDNEENDVEASSRKARHVRRREGERPSHHSIRTSSRDKTRGGDEEGGENYARRREESEGDKYGYNRPYNRGTIPQQQQQSPYNTYNHPAPGNTYAGGRTNSNNAYQYEGNAGRAEMNRTRSYHAPNMPQQGYATPSYRDKGRMDTPNYNNSNRGYNAGPAERQYGRRANDTRQYGYNSPAGQAQYHQPAQRWRTEASSYGPQSRTRQNYRGGRNNNNDDDESDLY